MYWIYLRHNPQVSFNTLEESIKFIGLGLEQWKQLGIPQANIDRLRSEYTINYMGKNIDWQNT
jgi:hypothetical protein